jgi:hypothetical protein
MPTQLVLTYLRDTVAVGMKASISSSAPNPAKAAIISITDR